VLAKVSGGKIGVAEKRCWQKPVLAKISPGKSVCWHWSVLAAPILAGPILASTESQERRKRVGMGPLRLLLVAHSASKQIEGDMSGCAIFRNDSTQPFSMTSLLSRAQLASLLTPSGKFFKSVQTSM
jgi:hypothetical protein